MKSLTKQMIVLLIASAICFSTAQAQPNTLVQSAVSETQVYVCTYPNEPHPCNEEDLHYGPISYENDYVRHVLANEWPGAAGDQALRAGAIVIRTFGWREIPCGAIDSYKSVGGIQYRKEHNGSQAYWLDPSSQTQNPILSQHTNAVNATTGALIRRGGDYEPACAKYNADCGNPTANGSEENWTLVSVPDPVDSSASPGLSGMSQNGTHAWELSGYAGAAPLDHRQMLSHYYAQLQGVPGAPIRFRWTWLDVDTTQTRYGRYYGPLAHTPRTMQTGRKYLTPFHIQNTGPTAWNYSGIWPERLSYHWYDSTGNNVVIWDGLRASLGEDVQPSQDIYLQANVVAPFQPGTYTLKWDMVSEELLWFSNGQAEGDWPTQNVTVNVTPSPALAFLPDVKNSGGWVSSIVVRNNGSAHATVDVTYLTTEADVSSSTSYWVSPQGSVTATPPAGFSGSAMVAASQDVAVIVRSQRGDEVTIYNGLKASGGSPGWEQVGNTLYAPIVKNNRYGRSSAIEVLNTGSTSTTVYAYFYEYAGAGGSGAYVGLLWTPEPLAPSARYTFNAADKCPAGKYCSVRLWSSDGQPLAAVVREYASGGSAPTTHNAFAAAATTNYVPLYKNARYGQTSGIAVMNTGGSTAYVTLPYYDANSAATYTASDSVPPKAVKTFVGGAGGVPAGFIGAAVVSANQPVVSALHESGGNFYKATDSFLSGASALYAAELNTNSGYASGLAVQNAGGSSATVQVYYYHSNGNSAGTRGPYTLPVGETLILNDSNGGVPASFYGSARIVSTNGVPLVAAVNYTAPGSGDTQATYNASNR